jgi:Mrp family chromosome partitioning ATPase
MARILEALRQVDASRPRLGGAEAAPDPNLADREPADVGPPEGEIPFIEVGGPRIGAQDSAVEFSAGASNGAARAPAPAAAPGNLVQVSFRPLPASPPLLKPACERFAPELVAFHQPEHPVSEQYRTLLAGLESQFRGSQPQVLLFTAATPRIGTTTVLLNLALTRALQGGIQIALLDANLSRPGLAERLGLPAAPGLCEVLAGAIAPPRALRPTGLEYLEVVTAGKPAERGLGLLASDVMRSLLHYLRGHYDLVLVDAPCWDGRPEIVSLGGLCDAVYLVTSRQAAEQPETENLVGLIPRQGARLRGCILTQC